MDYFPIFWFLGLYIYLLPVGDPNPIYGALALKSIYGLLVVSVVFVATYALSYRRHARSILEAVEVPPPRQNSWRLRLEAALERTLLARPIQRGCFAFIGRILARSSKHQVFLAVYLGIGISLGLTSLLRINPGAAFPFTIAADGMLELPLILSFFVISGLRATFNIPHELPANWIFQTTDARDSREHLGATLKWVSVCGLLPLAAFLSIIEFGYWQWNNAVFHLVFETVVSLILVQVLFFNFRKVPFTCSYYPGKRNIAMLAGVYLYGFTTYSSSMVALEKWLQRNAGPAVIFLVAGVAVIIALSSSRRRNRGRLIYEERSDTELQTIQLN
jgi:hypothetical protein